MAVTYDGGVIIGADSRTTMVGLQPHSGIAHCQQNYR